MFKSSIRIRLALLNSVTVLVVLLMMSFSIFFLYKQKLNGQVVEKLDNGYQTVVSVLENSGGDVYDIYHLGQTKPILIKKGDDSLWITDRWRYLKLPVEDLTETQYIDTRNFKDEPYKVRIGDVDRFGYTVYYAINSAEINDGLINLANIFFLSIPTTLFLTILSAYFLAGRSLNPIKTTIRQAKKINTNHLSERLPVINENDELGELNTIFNGMLDEIEESLTRLKQFTSDASHEFRTPLTSIKTISEVALNHPDGYSKEKYSETLSSILEETDHLENLIDDLLILTRMDNQKLIENFAEVDLSQLTLKVVKDLGVLAEEKSQEIVSDVDANLCVKGNSDLLLQSISNILHNSIKYSPDNGRISIRLGKKEEKVVLDIIDNGPGIPVEDHKKVFDRFYRLDKSRSNSINSLGLGLSIARKSIELHYGEISIMESRGQGSHFRIILPCL